MKILYTDGEEKVNRLAQKNCEWAQGSFFKIIFFFAKRQGEKRTRVGTKQVQPSCTETGCCSPSIEQEHFMHLIRLAVLNKNL